MKSLRRVGIFLWWFRMKSLTSQRSSSSPPKYFLSVNTESASASAFRYDLACSVADIPSAISPAEGDFLFISALIESSLCFAKASRKERSVFIRWPRFARSCIFTGRIRVDISLRFQSIISMSLSMWLIEFLSFAIRLNCQERNLIQNARVWAKFND